VCYVAHHILKTPFNMKAFVLFVAIAFTVFFINDKFSKAVRVIAFNEDESKNGAIISFLMMIVIIVAWTVFFSFF
jgi:hypothetical protein